MKDHNKTNPIQRGRRRTDASLRKEREKADKYSSKKHQATEQAVDENIQLERTNADANTQKNRERNDAARVTKRERTSVSIENERAYADSELRQERKRADRHIHSERARADADLSQERRRRKIAEELLFSEERGKTDKDLAKERRMLDSQIESSAQILQIEQASHKATKDALDSNKGLLAVVSHDLRNPIGAIATCAEMLLMESSEPPLDNEKRLLVDVIQRSATFALRLVRDLLDAERIGAQKLNLQVAKHDIANLVKQSAGMVSGVAAAKSILLRCPSFSESFVVDCDADRVTQVLSNLLENAVKFTPEGGCVTLSIRRVEEQAVEVSVSDTGPGIPADKKDIIFDRFFQIGEKNRRGLGLGLYIARSIIEAHGGKLWVESTVGEGSSFRFTLPMSAFH